MAEKFHRASIIWIQNWASAAILCVTVYLCLLWSTNMRALSNVIQPTTIDRCTNPLPPLLKLDPQNLCFGDTYLPSSMYQQRSRLWKEREWQRQWWWWWDPGGVNIWATCVNRIISLNFERNGNINAVAIADAVV